MSHVSLAFRITRVYLGSIRFISVCWVTSVHFGSLWSIRSSSVHFRLFRSSKSTLVHSIDSGPFNLILSHSVQFGPFSLSRLQTCPNLGKIALGQIKWTCSKHIWLARNKGYQANLWWAMCSIWTNSTN